MSIVGWRNTISSICDVSFERYRRLFLSTLGIPSNIPKYLVTIFVFLVECNVFLADFRQVNLSFEWIFCSFMVILHNARGAVIENSLNSNDKFPAIVENSPNSSDKFPTVVEAWKGDVATIICLSNDNEHRFQFWQLPGPSNRILGPGNKIDERKYRYQVLGGTLFIKRVSSEDSGIYTCVCKHIGNSTFQSKSVLLIVNEKWTAAWTSDSANLFREIVIAVFIFIIAVVVWRVYVNYKRDRVIRFKDFANESTNSNCRNGLAESLPHGRHGRIFEMREGIDNLAMDNRENTPPGSVYRA